MNEYWTILQAAQLAVSGLGALDGAPVKLRPELAFLRDNNGGGDPLPLALIAPDRNRWEQIGALATEGAMEAIYPVFVGLVYPNTFDQVAVQWVTAARQAIRDALFTTALQGAPTFDVEYDPAPRGLGISGVVPPLFPSVQVFRYSINSSRPNP